MNVVHPGDLIVSRYRIGERVPSDLTDMSAWAAHDQILDRTVRLAFLSGDHVDAALDSARRAALVSDARLTRVLDVGTEDGVAYVVTEPFAGISLSEVVASGIVDPQQARAVVGEAAAALEAARRRGVHHLALRPEAVRIDGSRVLVTGLGLDAGIAGQDLHDAERTSRADASGLVALLYYVMTARWAGPSLDVGWIDPQAIHPLPAHRDDSGVLSLGVARTDVPLDLVDLCDETFTGTDGSIAGWYGATGEHGPATPAEVAARLEPWGDVSVLAALPAFVQPRPTAPVAGVSRQSVRSAFETNAAAPAPPGTPPPAPPTHRAPATTSGRIHRSGVAAAGVGSIGVGVVEPSGATSTLPVGGAGSLEAAPAAVPPPAQSPGNLPPGGAAGGQYPPAPHGAAVPPSVPGPGSGYPAPSGLAPSPVSGQTAGRGEPPGRRGFNPTALVLTLALVGVVVGVFWAISQFGGLGPAIDPSGRPTTAQSAPAEPTDAGSEPEPESPAAAEVRPEIESGTALDPEGAAGGDTAGEHPEDVGLAFDGAPDTTWMTRTYKSPQFGGLKGGVGYAIALKEAAPVGTIILNTNNTGGRVEVRATTADAPTEGEVLAARELSPQTELTFAQPVEGQTFVLWFSELPRGSEGKFRVELNEILIS